MQQNSLDELTRRLRLPRRRRRDIARELASHVADARHDLVLSGWKPEDAGPEALARLGKLDALADAFTTAHRPSRMRFGMAVAISTGMILGVYGIGGSFASATAVHPAHHQSRAVVAHHGAGPACGLVPPARLTAVAK